MSDKKSVVQRLDDSVEIVSIVGDNEKITKALAIDPKHAIAYVHLALYYQKEGMFDETVAVLDKGLTVVPDNEILLMMRKDAENFRKPEATHASLAERA